MARAPDAVGSKDSDAVAGDNEAQRRSKAGRTILAPKAQLNMATTHAWQLSSDPASTKRSSDQARKWAQVEKRVVGRLPFGGKTYCPLGAKS